MFLKKTTWLRSGLMLVGSLALLSAACTTAADPTSVPTSQPTAVPTVQPTPVPPSPTPVPKIAKADLFVFSNSSPHVTVIDGESNQISRIADLPDFTSWTWNDDNNYFDGTDLWLGMKNADTAEIEVIALNLDTLAISTRLQLGPDTMTAYIGKANRDGTLLVGKMGSQQIVAIDTKNRVILSMTNIDVGGADGVVCDIDVIYTADGVERGFIPTDKTDLVLSINPVTGEILEQTSSPNGVRPFMLSVSPDGKTVWIQERGSNGNAVLDAQTLALIKRVPTAPGAIMNSFSPDGTMSYTAHSSSTVVVATNTVTLENVWEAQVGTNPQKTGVHPNGQWVYAIVT
ncbi:MAG: hypothetical protein O3B84_07630, partial [Chloroflexi bacterium]|nr:hypothetical protein [Chloroflexota bacterium]